MTSCQLSQDGEQLAVVGAAPELAADGGRVPQVFNGLEERDGHEAGVVRAFREPSTLTPPRRARRTTARTSSTLDAPLMT